MLNKIMVWGVVSLLLMSVVGLAYKHYTGLVEELSDAKVLQSELSIALKSNEVLNEKMNEAIDQWSISQDEYKKELNALRKVAVDSQRGVRELNDILSRHDLQDLAFKKPGLIERRINDGTSRAFSLLECATGSDSPDCPKHKTTR